MSASYGSGQWTYSRTPDAKDERYSSQVGLTTGGKAALTLNRQDRVNCEIANKSRPGSLMWGKVGPIDGALLGSSQWTVSGPSLPSGATMADCVSNGAYTGPDKDPAKDRPRLADLE